MHASRKSLEPDGRPTQHSRLGFLCMLLAQSDFCRLCAELSGAACRWPFLAVQQATFIESILSLNLSSIAREDILFISASLWDGQSRRRLLHDQPAPAGSDQRRARVLLQAQPSQAVAAAFSIHTNLSLTHTVATELFNASYNGSLAVGLHLRYNAASGATAACM